MKSDSYCVADLQQKHPTKVENLRNVSAEVIPLHFQMVAVHKRPHNYMSKNATKIQNVDSTNFGSFSLQLT